MPNSPIVADTLGWAYYKLGVPQSAIAALEESVQKAPNNPTYEFHLGVAYLAAGRQVRAGQLLQQVLRHKPDATLEASAKNALVRISTAQPK